MVASPPFSISTSTPGDSDIVSQFPLNERQMRDIIQQWILANHDSNGNHPLVVMPWGSTPTTPGASKTTLFMDSIGRLKYVDPTGTVFNVGMPPGAVIFSASSVTPGGFLVADGSAVSRSTFADLFTAIAVLYGSGNGSTTFNLPDIIGRVIAGEDGSSTRLSSSFFGATPTLAATGGLEKHQITLAQSATFTPAGTISAVKLSWDGPTTRSGLGVTTGGTPSFSFWQGNTPTDTTSVTPVFTGTPVGGNGFHNNTQPTIVLRALIKT